MKEKRYTYLFANTHSRVILRANITMTEPAAIITKQGCRTILASEAEMVVPFVG